MATNLSTKVSSPDAYLEFRPSALYQMTHLTEFLGGRKYIVSKSTFENYKRKAPWIIPFLGKRKGENGSVSNVELDEKFIWTDITINLYQGKSVKINGIRHGLARKVKKILESNDPQQYVNL
jgi:hypothetical protein